MSYRSDGWLYLSNKALEVIREDEEDKEFIDGFLKELEEHETKVNVWLFEDWKWYDTYTDVRKLNKLLDKLGDREMWDEYDLLVIGEDNIANIDYNTDRAFRLYIDVAVDSNLTNITA